MSIKFLAPLFGVILGIFITSEFIPGFHPGLICIGLALCLWIIITLASKSPTVSFKLSQYHIIWVILLFMGIGSLDFYFRSQPEYDPGILTHKVRFYATIEDVNALANGDRFKIKINSVYDSVGNPKFSRNLKVYLTTSGFVGNVGDRINFTATPLKYSEKEKRNLYERMRHQGILLHAYANSDDIEKIGEEESFIKYFRKLKENLIIKLEKSSIDRQTGNFLISILLGERSFLSHENRETLNNVGMAHVLALSGMHVATVFSILMMLLFPLSLLGLNRLRRISAILLVWGYVLITGCSPSTVRAAIMATFLVGSLILERKNSAINSLLAAAFIILLFDPWSLWNVGFQLSFVCVASIILFTNRLNPVEQHLHPKTYITVNNILVCIITTVCTWTLVTYYFRSVPITFLASNLILLPLFPFFFGFGALYLILLTFGLDNQFLSKILSLYHDLFIDVAGYFSFSGASSISFDIPIVSVVVWLVGIFLFALYLNSSSKQYKKLYITGGTFSLIIALSIPFLFPYEASNETIKFKHSLSKLEINLISDGKTQRLTFPRQNISTLSHDKFHVLSVDNVIHPDSLPELKTPLQGRPSYLIVGPGADLNQIAQLIYDVDFYKIILHAGINKNKKGELLSLLQEKSIDKIYSLRENGSLEFDL